MALSLFFAHFFLFIGAQALRGVFQFLSIPTPISFSPNLLIRNGLLIRSSSIVLPAAILSGALLYLIGRELPFPADVRGQLLRFVEFLQPALLFCMLFVAFCKVSPKALKPKRLHLWLALIQSGAFALCCLLLWFFPETRYIHVIEGFMLAMLCPTATACSVITQKLGGDAGITTSYTIFICLIVAVIAPLLLPIASTRHDLAFFPTFLLIIKKVFPLLLIPLALAWAARYLTPRLHQRIISIHNLAFYMWVVALALAISVTVRALVHSHTSWIHIMGIAAATLMACILQFWLGKKIGSRYGLRLEGGQALGQKNTIFIIWLGYTFLSPISATAGGFYSIWHNLVNSWQLYRKQKTDEKASSHN